ncbi:MAG: cysteine--tRNA ligase [Gammaproteobacteria bacterium]|nr:cysteine--tRNA ligase [Gammaproteobacteria bacterium]MCP5425682.1 cysteine--tRNA ligase [Gammaproteobacteria bacterium]MCP5459713.1 cysteine--tRNA ligase [Gammaproteobacteria bacterium]
MLQIYNSLSGQKEIFVPIEPGTVRMYVCGITVYDFCHVGNARAIVVFDVVVRYLRSLGYAVTYVRNITDIDDKIIRRAQENGETSDALAQRFIRAMHEDMDALKVLRPDIEPQATHGGSVEAMLSLIQTLVDKGYAYVGGNGDVYYDVSRFQRYGELANKKLDDLRAGSRVEVDEIKDDPLDFVLWKAAKPGEPQWNSPWGPGRPGWHIECSAMSMKCLGTHFDIHGGGMDLKFPHHENEIAQSEAATEEKFANYWMHNGFVQINEEKMSKSLGNFFTVREVLERYPAEAVRFFIVSSQYRSPLNYSDENLDQAKTALTRLYTALRDLPRVDEPVDEAYLSRFRAAMDDDFNTPEAMAVLFDLAREINRLRGDNREQAARLGNTLLQLGGVLGLLQDNPEIFLRGADDASQSDIQALIDQRTAARQAKNWAEADRLRDVLKEQGIVLEDKPEGTIWRRE